MELHELLERLGYLRSPKFLRRGEGRFSSAPDFGHVFRRAAMDPCRLQGVYTLRPDGVPESAIVPLAYVCDVPSETQARDVHRLVWNQDVVPFLIVNSPECVRAYCGFRYRPRGSEARRGLLVSATGPGEIEERLGAFRADSIDDASIWGQWGAEVTPEHRVDWRLLDNLERLGRWLLENGGMRDRHVAHALIGKYVFLHYLNRRGILSERKLAAWKIPREAVFGRNAAAEGLRAVDRQLAQWLNGSAFPIDFDSPGAPNDLQVSRVAGAFAGDRFEGDRAWQLHLDFAAFDFSYIPIETLSIVYQQFLHATKGKSGKTRGREVGAYYTPIPVVNLMLAEMEERRPLRRGMCVLDPACGSGAFLVQAYRRLIEREFPPGCPDKPTVPKLRQLLVDHFFGVDLDADACSVTELSLLLTMLDYVQPPDLEGGARPHLPCLRGRNIVEGNFFDELRGRTHNQFGAHNFASSGVFAGGKVDPAFGWVVGNPPWKQLTPGKLDEADPDDHEDLKVWRWMAAHRKDMPAGGNQIARAFAWRVADFIAENGEIGLFLPAMTLFDTQARDFRRKFLAKMRVRTVVNFANLAEVISAGRFRVPAAAFFYAPRREDVCEPDEAEVIRVYSPLVANQEPTRPTASRGKRNECWSIVINASDIRDIEASEVLGGSGLPWKLATWGSRLDLRLLRSVSKRFRSLGEMEKRGDLVVHEGPQLRTVEVRSGPEKTEEHPELVGRRVLATKPLERIRGIFTFPPTAYETNTQQFLRLRGGCAGLAVCRPPHVIVSAARNFAVYSDEFLIVPPRQIGISSPSGDTDMLKALSLYLSSDFAFYHQFLTATESGVKRDRATLGALRTLPVPLGEMNRNDLKRWANLHARLVEATKDAFREQERAEAPLCGGLPPGQVVPSELIGELNSLVYDSLRMDALEQALVKDLVHVRLELKDGKVGEAAVRKPTEEELRAYAVCLKGELDDFAGGDSAKRHQVQIVHDDLSGMVGIDFTKDRAAARKVVVAKAGRPAAEELERVRRRLRRERSQWVYFDRNLRIYEGPRTYVLKPMQRFHWTVTQAMLDAAEVIAETLGGEDAD